VDFAHVVEVADLDESVTFWVAALGARKNRYPKRAAKSTAVCARVLAPRWAALPPVGFHRTYIRDHPHSVAIVRSMGDPVTRGQDYGGGVAADALQSR
jgi:hypothetical protein